MESKEMIHLLKELNVFSMPVSEQRIRKSVLEYAKKERKGLSKDEVIDRGLNLYEKRGKSIDSLINDGYDHGLLDLLYDETQNQYQLEITEDGKQHLMELFTNNHSEAFRQFENEVNAMTERKEEPSFSKMRVASMFYHGHTMEEIEKSYLSDKTIQQEVSLFHDYYMGRLEIQPEEDDYVLHLMPHLFLPMELVGEPVTLKIEGLDVKGDIVLGSPYPNKRYVVAGTKTKGEKLLTGFYVKGKRKTFENGQVIRYVWTVADGITITHELTLMFSFDKGQLFSMTQHFNRDVHIPKFQLVSFFEKHHLENKKRTALHETKDGHIFLEEKATLTSFPPHLHYAFGGNKTYEDWLVKKLYS